jgi:hypothetical protein
VKYFFNFVQSNAMKKKQKKKQRSKHYEKPLAVNGTFLEVIKVAVRDEKKK